MEIISIHTGRVIRDFDKSEKRISSIAHQVVSQEIDNMPETDHSGSRPVPELTGLDLKRGYWIDSNGRERDNIDGFDIELDLDGAPCMDEDLLYNQGDA
jgi:hypothetical protein